MKMGLHYPTDSELLMLILGSGTKKAPVEILAEKILRQIQFSDKENLVGNLLTINGIGTGKALSVAAAIELGRRQTKHLTAVIRKPTDIIPYVKNYSIEKREHLLCITLSGAHEILTIRVISIGTLNQAIVHPREIFHEAIKENASAIILCHNHPSGNCTPSENDMTTTKRIRSASEIIGISLLDHIIISQDDYFSFAESNWGT